MPTETYKLPKPIHFMDFYLKLPSSVEVDGRQVTPHITRDYVTHGAEISRSRMSFARRIRIEASVSHDACINFVTMSYPNVPWAREYVGRFKESMGAVEEEPTPAL